LFVQFVELLPVPALGTESEPLAVLAATARKAARERYQVHQALRHRVRTDLLPLDVKLNQKLTAWWELDFRAFREETRRLRKADLPLKERAEWEDWLGAQKREHQRLTDAIVAAESEINDRVCRLFGLTAEEIRMVEEETRYRLGEV
jgi:hypothetical protein